MLPVLGVLVQEAATELVALEKPLTNLGGMIFKILTGIVFSVYRNSSLHSQSR